ncbi:protein-disulfide reductase DsbD domain-containing protein [Rhodohalobacter sp. SW132]|uniref:protein-disulfide reductase DsbD domain-containing protein n=1 Tax=Rhodohalobacter sp. SW132 TaxID=2293433 RepID=UPI001314979F|nr:protein-disulfide reductase DsbD domain-containing protein [Rhodohalobacter sp. SW132]
MFVLSAQAQLLDPVSYEISDIPDEVQAGEIFTISVTATIDGDWHLYSAKNDPDAGPYPTTFSSVEDHLFLAGDIEETEPKIVLDPNFNAELGWHSERAVFRLPVAFDTTSRGIQNVTIEVLYQVCDDRSCLPPKTKQVSTEIFVSGVSDSPFQPAATRSSNLFYSIYSSPAEVLPVLNEREWMFWGSLIFLIAVGFILRNQKV